MEKSSTDISDMSEMGKWFSRLEAYMYSERQTKSSVRQTITILKMMQLADGCIV